jgi:plastocyanin
MNPLRIGIILVLLAAAVFVPGAAHSAASATALVGTVGTGDAFVIRLTDAAGNAVTRLDPGDYTITIHDRSAFHNFHLSGPGVDQSTTEDFVGDVTWNVKLVDGSYHFQCDPHASRMKGDFVVGTAPPPPAPEPTFLSGAVGPKLTISLRTATGVRVKALTAGAFLITVRDRTRVDNFHLRGPGVNKSTGVRFRGTVRWAVTLRAGTYTYRSDRHKLRGSFRVSAG